MTEPTYILIDREWQAAWDEAVRLAKTRNAAHVRTIHRLLMAWAGARCAATELQWRWVREELSRDSGESFVQFVCFELGQWKTVGSVRTGKSKLLRHALRAPRHADLRRVVACCNWLSVYRLTRRVVTTLPTAREGS